MVLQEDPTRCSDVRRLTEGRQLRTKCKNWSTIEETESLTLSPKVPGVSRSYLLQLDLLFGRCLNCLHDDVCCLCAAMPSWEWGPSSGSEKHKSLPGQGWIAEAPPRSGRKILVTTICTPYVCMHIPTTERFIGFVPKFPTNEF